jgi:hypothetical protein
VKQDETRHEQRMSDEPTAYRTFAEFYPFYLSEHRNRTSRRLHFIGRSIAACLLVAMLATENWWLAAAALLQGYAFAWAGHFFFERNRPATFRYPLKSFCGDWKIWWEIISGQRTF